MKKFKEISIILTRPNKLSILEAASFSFWRKFPELTGYSFSVSVLSFQNNIATIWRNKKESTELLFQHLLEKIKKSPRFLSYFEKKFKTWLHSIKKISAKIDKKNLLNKEIAKIIKDFHYFYQEIWAGVIVVMWLPRVTEETKEIKKEFSSAIKKLIKLRQESEGLLGLGIDFYQKILDKIAQDSKMPLALLDNLKVKEIINYFQSNSLPPKNLLSERKRGCVLFNDRFYLLKNKSIKKFFRERGYVITEEKVNKEAKIIKGTTAYPGRVKGKVRLSPHYRDIHKFQKGEILVTPMTTPQYLPAMEKAAAIVTDEGGITCHAAIVSRELCIPCVIGTKIATKVLKDGDLVEVDADKEVVRILKSK